MLLFHCLLPLEPLEYKLYEGSKVVLLCFAACFVHGCTGVV